MRIRIKAGIYLKRLPLGFFLQINLLHRRFVILNILCLQILLTLGCGGEKNDDEGEDGESTAACFNLVNGASTTSYDSVVLLLSETSLCTGTFVGHNALITASHCLDSSLTGGKRFVSGHSFTLDELSDGFDGGLEPLRAYAEGPTSNHTGTATPGAIDLGVLIFSDGTAPAVSKMLDRPPKNGEEIELVGFGLTKVTLEPGEGDGCNNFNKRQGTNEVILYDDYDGIYYEGRAVTDVASKDTSDAVNASGDSGGPVFIGGKVAGVVSASGRGSGVNSDKAVSYAVDLNSPDGSDFLNYVYAEEGITKFEEEAP